MSDKPRITIHCPDGTSRTCKILVPNPDGEPIDIGQHTSRVEFTLAADGTISQARLDLLVVATDAIPAELQAVAVTKYVSTRRAALPFVRLGDKVKRWVAA